MSIRYFATNRDRENLGRDLDRKTRIELQKGGYHWVDTKQYMSHYLSTTDPSTMPPKVIIPNSDEVVFSRFLQCPAVKRIIIGVHGFNVHLHGALTSFSMLADTLRTAAQFESILITDPTAPGAADQLHDPGNDITAFVGFSWPANGNLLSYQSDRTEAISSASALANVIGCIRLKNPSAKIHLIAHSMGNYLACHMLKKLVDQEITPLEANEDIKRQTERRDFGGADTFFLDRYIMLAPDVERRHITQCDVDDSPSTKAEYLGPFHAGLYHLVNEVHHFYSRFDAALMASNLEKSGREVVTGIREVFVGENPDHRWEQSLGLSPIPNIAPPNMRSYNAVTLTNREIDHSDYMDAQQVADRIAHIIMAAN